MEKILDNFKYLGVVLTLLFFASCESEMLEEYESIDVTDAPSLEITVTDVQDSVFVIDYSIAAKGWLFVAVMEGNEESVTEPTQEEMRFQNLSDAAFNTHFKIDEDEYMMSDTVEVTGLEQNTEYVVFVMPGSVDGVNGEIMKTSLVTSDIYTPEWVGTTPVISSQPSQPIDFAVDLTFDEPVLVNNSDGFVFRYLNIQTFEFNDVVAESVSASGNTVTVVQAAEPIPGQYVFLSVSDDAVKDRSDNMFAGFTSGLSDEGALEGHFWRAEFSAVSVVEDGVSPEIGEAQQDNEFEIVLTFDLPMDFNRSEGSVVYDPQNVILSYDIGQTSTNVGVPADNIAFDGNVVTITQPRSAVFGETVSLIVNEGAFRTVYGSPVAAIEKGDMAWLVSFGYERDMILGSYVIEDMVSHFDGPIDLTLNIEITAHDEDLDKVLINNLLDSETPIEAIFNGDFATLTIPGGQLLSAGTLNPDWSVEVWNGYVDDGTAVGFIESDGTILMEGLGFYLYDLAGEGLGYWDLFPTSTWSPTIEKINSMPANLGLSGIKKLTNDKLIIK